MLLISNSTLHGSGYLDDAESQIRDFLGELKRVLFVPFAVFRRDKYAVRAQALDRRSHISYLRNLWMVPNLIPTSPLEIPRVANLRLCKDNDASVSR